MCISKMMWLIEQIDWMIFVYREWWISIEATKICYFGLALSGIGSLPTRFSDVLNLKHLKTIWGIKLIFCFHWSYKKYHTILGYTRNTPGQSICRIFYFWLVWLVNLNTGGPLLHCTCYFWKAKDVKYDCTSFLAFASWAGVLIRKKN